MDTHLDSTYGILHEHSSRKYVFRIRCTNGDKIWGHSETSLRIRILKPWWNTIVAYCAYIALAILILTFAFRILWIREIHRNRLRIESIRRRQITDTYEAKLSFFTNVALHEFSTPLTLISSSIEQIVNNYNLPVKVEKYNRIIKNNADNMMRLIDELIEFRRISMGGQKPAYSQINVRELMLGILENFSVLTDEQSISLETELPDLSIVSDRNALEKILYNLISNAYKYTPVGGKISVSIQKEAKEDSSDCGTTITVTNSGKGIKPESLSKVFDRFSILDSYEKQASKGNIMRNGIGMALVDSLVRMLSGKSLWTAYRTATRHLP